jgi:hypothetical protein
VWPEDAEVAFLQVTLKLAGDVASYECDFQIKVDGTAVGTVLAQDTSTVVGTQNRQAQGITIDKGDIVEIVVSDGGSGCAGTIDPKYTLEILGQWVDNL